MLVEHRVINMNNDKRLALLDVSSIISKEYMMLYAKAVLHGRLPLKGIGLAIHSSREIGIDDVETDAQRISNNYIVRTTITNLCEQISTIIKLILLLF